MPPNQYNHAGAAERGSVAVEFALAVPMILLILATLVQLFAWGMGHLAAQAAADRAAQTARLVDGNASSGQRQARELLTQLDGSFLADPTVAVTRGVATTTVTIRGRSRGVPLPIEVRVVAPTERFTTAQPVTTSHACPRVWSR